VTIDSLLQQFEHFGVSLGLDRIQHLLAALDNPHQQVPIIHVAGTNGKGSVCTYLSSILTQAGYRVGRYTSPHLIDWNERISLNNQPISDQDLYNVLDQVKEAIDPNVESPTQFEVITAAAWLYFAQQKVDVAVMEVGLGGRLDATNVCDRPLVSIITSISWEHWQRLGPTLAHIAFEKAGILKPNCPAVVGALPPEAQEVVEKRVMELGCPVVWPSPAVLLDDPQDATQPKVVCEEIEYNLPILGDVQLVNSALAIAALQILRRQGWQISDQDIQAGMAQASWPGRIQWVRWNNAPLLIDGAHNGDAAQVLRRYVDTLKKPAITWVVGMLSTKDHTGIFQALLRPGDKLYLVPVPDHSSSIPEELASISLTICPDLAECKCFDDLEAGLIAAFSTPAPLTVLCGSLYLIGHFLEVNSVEEVTSDECFGSE
jgi:dihydrofolate synthase/folylpolyglutamate synthase